MRPQCMMWVCWLCRQQRSAWGVGYGLDAVLRKILSQIHSVGYGLDAVLCKILSQIYSVGYGLECCAVQDREQPGVTGVTGATVFQAVWNTQ